MPLIRPGTRARVDGNVAYLMLTELPARSGSTSWRVVRRLWCVYGVFLAVGLTVLASSSARRVAAPRPIPVVDVSDNPTAAARAWRNLPPRPPVAAGSWTVADAFPNLVFNQPVFLMGIPGSNRLIVGELQGRILAFDNDPQASQTSTILDISSRCQAWGDCGLLALAFHPEFGRAGLAHRGDLYLWYQHSENPTRGPERAHERRTTHLRLSRFTVSDRSEAVDPESELVLIEQEDRSLWHAGGGIFFGARDGFLYLSLGDEGGTGNEFDNAQRIDRNLFSGVIRIDVDCDPSRSHPITRQPARGRTAHYFIPNDNPFVGLPGALEEFWCIGLRSPHRMTQDLETGTIWASDTGDVGIESREEINLIHKGGNYEWDLREGSVVRKAPVAALIGQPQPPIHEYPRAGGNRCAIGGYVYRGHEHAADLAGKYVFGDNCSGRIWVLDLAGGKPPQAEELCALPAKFRADSGLSSFAVDNSAELYLCVLGKPDRPSGAILKLARPAAAGSVIPAQLSMTGVFRDTRSLTVAPGMIPYEINAPLWSDGAEKRRWMSLPGDADAATRRRIAFNREGNWLFPSGTVFVKHFELPGFGPGGSARRLETRILVRDPDDSVYGMSYKWRDDQTDADLVEQGVNEAIVSADSSRRQTWFFPGTADCLTCHNANAGFVLGVNGKQINRPVCRSAGSQPINQLQLWNELDLFEERITESQLASLRMWRLTPPDDPAADLEDRVKSYLEVNCGTCHRPHEAHAGFDARFDAPIHERSIIHGRAVSVRSAAGMQIVTPGDLQHSLLFQRMNSESADRMPPLARNQRDRAALNLLARWIEQMPQDRQSDEPPPRPPPVSKSGILRGRSLVATFMLLTLALAAATVRVVRHPEQRVAPG
jgi:uncharacterized repeat protein (TIGR03806 family)